MSEQVTSTAPFTLLGIMPQAIDWRVDYQEGDTHLSAVFGRFYEASEFVRELLPPNERVYEVIGLTVDDAIALDDWDEANAAAEQPGRYRAGFLELSEQERARLAAYLGDVLWDAQLFEEALREFLDKDAARPSEPKPSDAAPEAAGGTEVITKGVTCS